MDDVSYDEFRYGPYIIRIWYNNGIPDNWHRVPKTYSTVPTWLSDAMDAWLKAEGYSGMEPRDYLVSLFGEQF